VERERDPSGDYGYDLAHDDTGVRAGSGDRGAPEHPRVAPEHPRRAPERPAEPGGDYGYDEAHGF
jgi:hypothetical protein